MRFEALNLHNIHFYRIRNIENFNIFSVKNNEL